MRWIAGFLLLLSLGGAASGQTLADIARQERARKKAIESKIVIPDATLPPPALIVTATVDPGKTPDTPVTPTGPLDNQGRDEKYWRGTFETARQNLKRAEDNSRLLDLKVNELSGQLLREGIAMTEIELRAALDTAKQQQVVAVMDVEAARQRLRDLEEELRRSGGLPGWAR